MSTPKRKNRFLGIFDTLASAMAVSAAIERRAVPKRRDLRMLGIDPDQFDRIGR